MVKQFEETLLDDQVQTLLKNAESRISTRACNTASQPLGLRTDVRTTSDVEESLLERPYISVRNGMAHVRRIDSQRHNGAYSAGIVRQVEDPVSAMERKREEKGATAGPNWFDLPRTRLTPTLKRDLQLLHMRSALDPHRHYRRSDNPGSVPAFSQIGMIVEGPTEFYTGRIKKRDRKQTLAEEILATEDSNRRFKAKYNEIQAKKTDGKKRHYKAKRVRRSSRPIK